MKYIWKDPKEDDRIFKQGFIISQPKIQNIDLVKKILKNFKLLKFKLGKKTQIKFVKDRPGHDFRYALDSKKILKKLKWKSKINLKKGLENTFNWYFQNMKYYTTLKKKDITKRLGVIK